MMVLRLVLNPLGADATAGPLFVDGLQSQLHGIVLSNGTPLLYS